MSQTATTPERNKAEPHTLFFIPDTIRVEYQPGQFLTLDIVETKMELDEILVELPRDANSPQLLHAVVTWFKNRHNADVSMSTAYRFFIESGQAYLRLKKKLTLSLASLSGTGSTPTLSLPAKQGNSIYDYLRSWLKGKSGTDAPPAANSPQPTPTT